MAKRKTHTSAAVKDRWNKAHYDQVTFRCKIGGKEMIKDLAEENGQTLAEYIRRLILQDAQIRGKTDVVELLGGGGV